MTEASSNEFAVDPIAELKTATTWLVRDSSQRQLVIKALPDDCLRHGQLHPSVQDRLARFRELPLMTFASLIGVERFRGRFVTVSEYVRGVSLSDAAPADRRRVLESLRHTVAALHGMGLVHGGLHGGNVIVDERGELRVIDPSPLLHDDPAEDLAALDRLDPLPKIATQKQVDDDVPIRQGTLRAAAIVTGVGAAVGAGVLLYFWRSA